MWAVEVQLPGMGQGPTQAQQENCAGEHGPGPAGGTEFPAGNATCQGRSPALRCRKARVHAPCLHPVQGGPIQSISQAGSGVCQPHSCVQGLFGKAMAWAKAIVARRRLWAVVQWCLGCLTATDPAKYLGWPSGPASTSPCLAARISLHFAGEEADCTGL